MKSFTFLIHNIYHIGGTTRAVINLANCLNDNGHDVTLLTVFKSADEPAYPVHNGIHINYIIDYKSKLNITPKIYNRIRKYTPLMKPTKIQPFEPGISQFNKHIEKKIIQHIRKVDTDYLVGTRASYNLLIAEYSENNKTIGMEHMHFNAHPAGLKKLILKQYRKLDYISTLSPVDQRTYQRYFPSDKVIQITNMVTQPEFPVSYEEKENIITALGRLESEKGFDRLIESVSSIQNELREKHYEIHLYGSGSEEKQLKSMINERHIDDIFIMKGNTNDAESVLRKSKITVIPSRSEGFGMVILEAFTYKNAVVSFDARIGPRWLLNHNINALVALNDNHHLFGKYILDLINNPLLASTLIMNAGKTLTGFTPEAVYQQIKDQISL